MPSADQYAGAVKPKPVYKRGERDRAIVIDLASSALAIVSLVAVTVVAPGEAAGLGLTAVLRLKSSQSEITALDKRL